MAPARPLRILVVDDNDVLRALLGQALESGGYEVIAAESVAAALQVVHPLPDLCIVDYAMPGPNGAELVAALRAMAGTGRVPVIGLSGIEEGVRALAAAGAEIALRKPVAERVLLETVAQVLGLPLPLPAPRARATA